MLYSATDRGAEHGGALRGAGPAAAERLDGRLGLPALEDVDAAGLEQVGGDGEVEAALCSSGLFDDAGALREVVLVLLRVDQDVSCDVDHVGALGSRRGRCTGQTFDSG